MVKAVLLIAAVACICSHAAAAATPYPLGHIIDPDFGTVSYSQLYVNQATQQQQQASTAVTAADCWQHSAEEPGLDCAVHQTTTTHHEINQPSSSSAFRAANAASSSSSSRRQLQQAANPSRFQKPYTVCVSPLKPLVTCSPNDDQRKYTGVQQFYALPSWGD